MLDNFGRFVFVLVDGPNIVLDDRFVSAAVVPLLGILLLIWSLKVALFNNEFVGRLVRIVHSHLFMSTLIFLDSQSYLFLFGP